MSSIHEEIEPLIQNILPSRSGTLPLLAQYDVATSTTRIAKLTAITTATTADTAISIKSLLHQAITSEIFHDCLQQAMFVDAPSVLILGGGNPTSIALNVVGRLATCSIRKVGGKMIDEVLPPDENGSRSYVNLALQFSVGAVGGATKYSIGHLKYLVSGATPIVNVYQIAGIGALNNGFYQLYGSLNTTALSGNISSAGTAIILETMDEIIKWKLGGHTDFLSAVDSGIDSSGLLTLFASLSTTSHEDYAATLTTITELIVAAEPPFHLNDFYGSLDTSAPMVSVIFHNQ